MQKITCKIALNLALLIAVAGIQQIAAQTTPQQILNRIYQKYDSLRYITFDVKYVYTTDTISGRYKKDVMKGSFTMAGKKALYNIGSIQFMQNDSFFISVNPEEKYIIVADPRSRNSGNELPMRAVLDSMVQVYAKQYLIRMSSDSVEGTIRFVKSDSMAQFNSFMIKYDLEDYYLSSIRYEFEEPDVLENESETVVEPEMVIRKKSFEIRFSDYRIDNFSPKNFDESNYIWFDEGECKTSDKYKGFRIFYSRTGIF